MPKFGDIEEDVFPKRVPVIIYHLEDHVSIYIIENIPRLVELGDGTILPHLQLAIEYPGLLKYVYVDDGAVRALLRGADLMAPGIKQFDETFEEGEVLEIRVLGTSIPFAIGVATVSSSSIAGGKGLAIKIVHLLKDGLWDHRNGMQ
jgi:PUA domain protein